MIIDQIGRGSKVFLVCRASRDSIGMISGLAGLLGQRDIEVVNLKQLESIARGVSDVSMLPLIDGCDIVMALCNYNYDKLPYHIRYAKRHDKPVLAFKHLTGPPPFSTVFESFKSRSIVEYGDLREVVHDVLARLKKDPCPPGVLEEYPIGLVEGY